MNVFSVFYESGWCVGNSWEVPVWNLGLVMNCSDTYFVVFFRPSMRMPGQYLEIEHDSLPQNIYYPHTYDYFLISSTLNPLKLNRVVK
jgi:hypothetical protein